MPIHDWTRVDAGLFHAFHQDWIGVLARALNAGVLPPDYFALPEQSIQGPVPEVLTLNLAPTREKSVANASGLAVATVPPRARLVRRAGAASPPMISTGLFWRRSRIRSVR